MQASDPAVHLDPETTADLTSMVHIRAESEPIRGLWST